MQPQQNVTQWRQMIDSTALTHVINECMKKSQHRIAMLKLDWNDQVIQLAKQIWQSTDGALEMKDQLEILRLPPKTDYAVNQLLDDQIISLPNAFMEKDQLATFATRCSNVTIR